MTRARLRPRRSPSLPALALLAALLAVAGGCSKDSGAKPDQAGGGRPKVEFPVEVQAVTARPVEYAVSAVGSVEAFETVPVTARVAGVIERKRFTEGDPFTAGQPLLEDEPQRHPLAVD